MFQKSFQIPILTAFQKMFQGSISKRFSKSVETHFCTELDRAQPKLPLTCKI